MKLVQTLVLGLLPWTALAAKKSTVTTDDRFAQYHSQSLSAGPLKLDEASFDDLTAAPRNFSAAVLLTARGDRFGCVLCREFQPEWDLLGKSWAKGDKAGDSNVIFGTLDFNDGKGPFQKLQLQTVPILVVYLPTVGAHAAASPDPVRYSFSDGQGSIDKVHGWISRQLPEGPRPPIVRPINYLRIVVVTTAVLGVITFVSVAAPYILPVVQNKNLWAATTLIAVLLFTSGHMFNHIRKVPYVAGDGKNGISYFAGGFQSQYGLETQIVAAMYGVLAFATISLAMKVPRMSDPRAQQVAVFAWSAVMLGMYSFLMSVFRIKNGGYPFYLPPF
ncbi:MAG: oligosaccharyl transferase subunit ost3/OST6 [Thelocarpon superellum]|nr:MAG: oligosaccharyl transferase subunit ost3/OST6 [Thelocarpon superellum]